MYFAVCRCIGRVLRAGRYSRVCDRGDEYVLKQRVRYAPPIVWLGNALFRMLRTGVRVLPQREWEAQEVRMYRLLYKRHVEVTPSGALILPRLSGNTLAGILTDGEDASGASIADLKWRAITLAARALRQLHACGFTHADAMADNVMIDMEHGTASWFDFETMHDPRRTVAWSRADDLRALLMTCAFRMPASALPTLVSRLQAEYRDAEVWGLLADELARLRPALVFHLGQAPLSQAHHAQLVTESVTFHRRFFCLAR